MVSSGLWDEAVPRPSPACPEASQAQGFPSLPGNKPGDSPFPWPWSWLLLPALSPSREPAALLHPLPCSFSISFVLLLPVLGGAARQAQPAAPSASPLRQLVPRPRLCPQGRRSRLLCPAARAPPVSREQLSVRERVRAGCSASGPVQFYCTGANRTEVGIIGGFLALPAPQREPWVSFFCWFVFFFVLCFSPARAGVSPLGALLPAFPRGPGSTFFKPRVFLPLGVYSGCSFSFLFYYMQQQAVVSKTLMYRKNLHQAPWLLPFFPCPGRFLCVSA